MGSSRGRRVRSIESTTHDGVIEAVPSTPRFGSIAGGVITSYRASLIERDIWDHVLARFAQRGPRDAEWLDAVTHHDWVDAQAFVTLLDAIGDTLGLDGLRSLVRKRIADPGGSNFYSPILRSWARSFGTNPESMLRGVVHVWRAALRNAGKVTHQSVREGEVHLLIEGPLTEAYRESPALCSELEGMAFSLLDSAHPRPMFVEVELDRQRPALVCTYRD
ncbi:MAG: hypothetical protein ABW352_04170 [Polyangiales bacterium]